MISKTGSKKIMKESDMNDSNQQDGYFYVPKGKIIKAVQN